MSHFGKKSYLTFKILFKNLNLRSSELEFLIRELGWPVLFHTESKPYRQIKPRLKKIIGPGDVGTRFIELTERGFIQ